MFAAEPERCSAMPRPMVYALEITQPGNLEHLLGTAYKAEHHEALPYDEVPDFVARLQQQPNTRVARAMELLVLRAEIGGARWSEFDFEAKVWTLPAARRPPGRNKTACKP
jgi:integrase